MSHADLFQHDCRVGWRRGSKPTWLLKNKSGQIEPHEVPARRPGISDIVQWIQDNLHERPTVSELASKVMMSGRHFARVFQHEVGRTALEFIEACRFERATQLLSDPSLPLKTQTRSEEEFGKVEGSDGSAWIIARTGQ